MKNDIQKGNRKVKKRYKIEKWYNGVLKCWVYEILDTQQLEFISECLQLKHARKIRTALNKEER